MSRFDETLITAMQNGSPQCRSITEWSAITNTRSDTILARYTRTKNTICNEMVVGLIKPRFNESRTKQQRKSELSAYAAKERMGFDIRKAFNMRSLALTPINVELKPSSRNGSNRHNKS